MSIKIIKRKLFTFTCERFVSSALHENRLWLIGFRMMCWGYLKSDSLNYLFNLISDYKLSKSVLASLTKGLGVIVVMTKFFDFSVDFPPRCHSNHFITFNMSVHVCVRFNQIIRNSALLFGLSIHKPFGHSSIALRQVMFVFASIVN